MPHHLGGRPRGKHYITIAIATASSTSRKSIFIFPSRIPFFGCCPLQGPVLLDQPIPRILVDDQLGLAECEPIAFKDSIPPKAGRQPTHCYNQSDPSRCNMAVCNIALENADVDRALCKWFRAFPTQILAWRLQQIRLLAPISKSATASTDAQGDDTSHADDGICCCCCY